MLPSLSKYLLLFLESIRVRVLIGTKSKSMHREITEALQENHGSIELPENMFLQISRFTSVLRRLPWARPCLVKAVTMRRMLLRQGIRSHLRIGAHGDSSSKIEIHAWLEIGGWSFLKGNTPFTTFQNTEVKHLRL